LSVFLNGCCFGAAQNDNNGAFARKSSAAFSEPKVGRRASRPYEYRSDDRLQMNDSIRRDASRRARLRTPLICRKPLWHRHYRAIPTPD